MTKHKSKNKVKPKNDKANAARSEVNSDSQQNKNQTHPTYIENSPTPIKQNSVLSKIPSGIKEILNWAGLLIVAIEIVNFFRPDVDISLGDSLNKKSPFKTLTVVTNRSHFEIKDIELTATIDSMRLNLNGLVKNCDIGTGQTGSIRGNESKAFEINPVGVGNDIRAIIYASATYSVKYKFFGFDCTEEKRYLLHYNSDDEAVWSRAPLL